jgi:hypothetical protein
MLRAEWSQKVSTVSGGIFRCSPPVAAATAVPPPARPARAPAATPVPPAGDPADQSAGTCTHAGSVERPAALAATLRFGYCCGHGIAFAVEHDRIHLQIDLVTSTDPFRAADEQGLMRLRQMPRRAVLHISCFPLSRSVVSIFTTTRGSERTSHGRHIVPWKS